MSKLRIPNVYPRFMDATGNYRIRVVDDDDGEIRVTPPDSALDDSDYVSPLDLDSRAKIGAQLWIERPNFGRYYKLRDGTFDAPCGVETMRAAIVDYGKIDGDVDVYWCRVLHRTGALFGPRFAVTPYTIIASGFISFLEPGHPEYVAHTQYDPEQMGCDTDW